MSPNAGEGERFAAQLMSAAGHNGAQKNFRDLTPYLFNLLGVVTGGGG